MSASQRVQILADKAEELSVLSEFLRNPNLIQQLQDEIVKLNSLTADEEARVAQARKDLREHAGKMDILQTSMEELTKAHEAHKAQVAIDTAELDRRSQSLDALAQTLHEVDTRQIAKDKVHADERKQLDAHAVVIQKAAADLNDKLSKREDAVKKSEDNVAAAAIRIESDRKKLAEKMKLLSE